MAVAALACAGFAMARRFGEPLLARTPIGVGVAT
jgi:hypothetical protein